MFDSLTWLHLTWLKLKTQQLAPIRKRNPSLMTSVFTFGQTRRMSGERRSPSTSVCNAHGAVFRPSCFASRDPEDSTESRGRSAAHITYSPHFRQKCRGLCLAFRSEEDSGQTQIWTTSTLWPRQTLLHMCPSQHEPHFFRSFMTLSCPLHIFGTAAKSLIVQPLDISLWLIFCSVFWNYFQPRTSLYHII